MSMSFLVSIAQWLMGTGRCGMDGVQGQVSDGCWDNAREMPISAFNGTSVVVSSDRPCHFKLRILMLSTPLLTNINLRLKSKRQRRQTRTPRVSQGHEYYRWNKRLIKCLPIQAASCAQDKCDGNCIYQSCFSVSS